MGQDVHKVNPAEDLHNMASDGSKQSVDGFVNPGTPASPLVGMADRKTGQISGAASEALRSRLTPTSSDTVSMSSKSNAVEGMLPSGN